MIAVVDYGMGNLRSVERGFARVGAGAVITHDPEAVLAADAVVLPGVGAFGDAMSVLEESGLTDALRETAAAGRPVIGVCLGLQLLFETSDEDEGPDGGPVQGLGILPGHVERLPGDVKVPHIGWNRLRRVRPHPVLEQLPRAPYVYFVHSYRARPTDSQLAVATCDYGATFPAIVGRDRVIGLQFHPEKSGSLGLRMLANLAAWIGA